MKKLEGQKRVCHWKMLSLGRRSSHCPPPPARCLHLVEWGHLCSLRTQPASIFTRHAYSQTQFPNVAQTLPQRSEWPSLFQSQPPPPGLDLGRGWQLAGSELMFLRSGRAIPGVLPLDHLATRNPSGSRSSYLTPGQLSQDFPFLVLNRSRAAVLVMFFSVWLNPWSSLVLLVSLDTMRSSRGWRARAQSRPHNHLGPNPDSASVTL